MNRMISPREMPSPKAREAANRRLKNGRPSKAGDRRAGGRVHARGRGQQKR
jgi:hypothetical protein